MGGLGEGSGVQLDTGQFPGPLIICWSDAHELESPEEEAEVLLLPHSLPDDCHSTADRWLK